MMPSKNGIELSKILKTDIRTAHIPIILLAAQTTREQQLEVPSIYFKKGNRILQRLLIRWGILRRVILVRRLRGSLGRRRGSGGGETFVGRKRINSLIIPFFISKLG